ncbi:PTS transporter subunit IIC [Sporolactobacillus spathodeae]|uniref:Membrane protein n=1 Tax=Sporolactobacillus spathodeae TaxID=1465502 RepID=A0ABS2Q542_9BACL|nr:PTS sugar transporter subunit IIC [Sporolactobacillus spathodeae]MBM7656903.1 putative membrane protein [Sporolactobacillus spathodeae]
MNADRKEKMKKYFMDRMYKASAGIANAILVTLGVGLLFETLGKFTGYWPFLAIGGAAKVLLAPAIGAGIAYQLRANTLTMFSAMACSAIGANAIQIVHETPVQQFQIVTGQPVSGVIAALIAIYVGKKISGKTKFDMMAIPFFSVLCGGVAGYGLALVVTPALNQVSAMITNAVHGQPLISSMVIALVWSIFLMSPASSAALAIALQLDPVSAGAALIGCTVQFVGFTVMSFKENDFGGFFAQAFVTPKVQFPNLVKNPLLVIPPFAAALISAPIATMMLHFQVPYELGGLGLSSFIAPLNILAIQGIKGLMAYVVAGVLIPGVITMVLYRVIKVAGWVKAGDLHMEVQ